MASETQCCDNVVTTLSDVATKIQPKSNVATTSCACWDRARNFVNIVLITLWRFSLWRKTYVTGAEASFISFISAWVDYLRWTRKLEIHVTFFVPNGHPEIIFLRIGFRIGLSKILENNPCDILRRTWWHLGSTDISSVTVLLFNIPLNDYSVKADVNMCSIAF